MNRNHDHIRREADPAKLDLDADTPRERRCINQPCLILLSTDATDPAEPVRVRLAAYLDHRNQRWPHTANPHLFIHHRTALGTKPVGARWPGLVLGTAARDIRTDRILDEVRATGGDLRRICALFGLSVKAAARYTSILDHPDLVGTRADPASSCSPSRHRGTATTAAHGTDL